MNRKLRVGIIFGGKSAEHEVSLQSAKNVVDALDTEKYEVTLIGIDRSGRWLLPNQSRFLLDENNPKLVKLNEENAQKVVLAPEGGGELRSLSDSQLHASVDVVFPLLHGPFGEDGTVQGLLKLANVPFVGSGVLGSALGMDKDVMKRFLQGAGVPVAKFLTFRNGDAPEFENVKETLGMPVFVKPANLGSSVGVSKVRDQEEFETAVAYAFRYDTKILIEEMIAGREIECGVLGNQNPVASVVGEVLSNHEFYSYEAKYTDENGAMLKMPADISEKTRKNVQELSVKVFQSLECEGLGRIDFFLKENGEIFVNEINTMPGFTNASMYPRLWEASGVSYGDLIDRLIQLAIERFERERNLKTSRSLQVG